jgi:hypothetical protein
MNAWRVATTDVFDEWFGTLDSTAQAEVIAKVELLKVLGPALRRPHADTLSESRHKNMKELRADTANAVLRIAFAFDPTRSAILLCAGNKTGVSQSRFYKQLIDRADKLYDAHLARLDARQGKRGR